jgi:hypothetical protein
MRRGTISRIAIRFSKVLTDMPSEVAALRFETRIGSLTFASLCGQIPCASAVCRNCALEVSYPPRTIFVASLLFFLAGMAAVLHSQARFSEDPV